MPPYPGTDEQLLDEIQRGSFAFFWHETNPGTGLVKDRALLNGNDRRTMSSIAATGFGLTALCIADARGYAPSVEIADRVRATLRFLSNMPTVRGFYCHFIDMNSGERWRDSELSSIDTSLLLCGVLTARQYFKTPRFRTSRRRSTIVSIGRGCSTADRRFPWAGCPRAASLERAGNTIAKS